MFKFKITSLYKDCLSRQIGEALRIYYSKDDILNSKCEYMDNCITRLTIEESPWENREKNEEEELDKLEVEKFKEKIEDHTRLEVAAMDIVNDMIEKSVEIVKIKEKKWNLLR